MATHERVCLREARVMKMLVVVAMVMCGACASTRWTEASPAQRDAWMRCQIKVADAQCAPKQSASDMAWAMCVSRQQAQYVEAAVEDRKTWLVQHGCPSEMVGDI